jgi:hypothetical protein
MIRRSIVIALVSLTLVGLELLWTRIFSAEFFYTFAFLTLSLAILGLGLGALSLRLAPRLADEKHVPWYLSLAGLFTLAGPPLVFRLGVDFSLLFTSWGMLGRFAVTLVLLGAPFFFSGMALALLFRIHHREIARLYMADLAGAGAGVVAALAAMNVLGTPAAAAGIALPVLAAAVLSGGRWRALFPVLLLAAMVPLAREAPRLMERSREERAPVVYTHWDAMGKIKLYDFGGQARGINIDNVANSPVFPFDGDWEAWRKQEVPWDINVAYLVARFDSCRFLSLGAGGGSDVMQALEHGAGEVHAVEVNPHVNRMMTAGDPSGYIVADSTVTDSTGRIVTCADYTGHLYRDPRVRVVTEDARTYVRRHRNRFDVIFSLSSNTWAALASGSFALAENYLFTTEAFMDYWAALSDSGFLSMEHQMYVPRLVSEVKEALGRLGVADPRAHFAVYELPRLHRKLLLLSRRPLTDDLRYRAYGPLTPERQEHIRLLYPAPDSLRDNLVQRIVDDGWRAAAGSSSVDLSPCTDDRPFAAQLGLWKNVSRESLKKADWLAEFRGFPLSKVMIVVILAVAGLLVLPLTLLPALGRGGRLRPVPWWYFFTIGAGFMMIEVVLIQQFTLIIGASVFSLAAVLFVLLVAAGLGSRFAPRTPDLAVFCALELWLLLDVVFFPDLARALTGLPLFGRVLASGLAVFPLGFFLGMPFPKAGLRVGALVDWGFAVNGVASVLGATGVVLIAVTQGFTTALLGAMAAYALAGILLSADRGWTSREPEPSRST